MRKNQSVHEATNELEAFLKSLLEPNFGYWWLSVKRDERVANELRNVAKFASQQERNRNMQFLVEKMEEYPESYKQAVQTYRSRQRGNLPMCMPPEGLTPALKKGIVGHLLRAVSSTADVQLDLPETKQGPDFMVKKYGTSVTKELQVA